MKKKITIIGGSGFVGSNLCTALAQKNIDFEIIDIEKSRRFPSRWRYGDVRCLDSLREAVSGTIVVNLAAVHRDDVRDQTEYQLTNVLGAENISLVCEEKAIKKIIFTSSVAVYGFAIPGTAENGAINPYNEYGRTKYEAEHKLRVWYAKGGKSLFIVRPTVIFGNGNRGNVYNLFKQIDSGKFFMVGKGINKKSMAYIGNIVAFLETCIETQQTYGIYNYVDTPNLSMNELVIRAKSKLKKKDTAGLRLPYWLGLTMGYVADFISAATGKNLPLSSIRVKKFVSPTEFGSAKNCLDNFEAPFGLIEALDKTLESEFLAPNPEREIFYTE